MKKIILALIIVVFSFSGVNAGYNKVIKGFNEYNSAIPENQIADSLYFPGGDYGMTKSKSSGTKTPFIFEKFHSYNNNGYNIYNYLYFGKPEYIDDNFKKLFNDINSKFNIKYKINNEDFPKEKLEKLEKDLKFLELEIKVDKFRFQNNNKANNLEKNIVKKLTKIYKQISESEINSNTSLEVIKNENNIICNNDLSIDYNFKTIKIGKINDIKKYYLFGLPDTNYHDEYNEKNNIKYLYYGSPWDKNNNSNAFIISKEDDLKNINKSKFYLQEINPEFKKVKYYKYLNNKCIRGVDCNKTDEIESINNELFFTLNYKKYLDFFKKNNNLFNLDGNYSFGEKGTKKGFNFMLLGVEKDGDIRILTSKKTKNINLDISKNVNSDIINDCERSKPGINIKLLKKTEIKINSIFEKLDKKYNIQEYKDFLYSIHHSDALISDEDYNEMKNKVLEKNGEKYLVYKKIVDKLFNKIEIIEIKNNNEINFLLNSTKNKVLENKNKISKQYFIKSILELLKYKLNEKKDFFRMMNI